MRFVFHCLKIQLHKLITLQDLLAWAQTFDPEVKQFSDLRTAVSLLGMVQRISGNRYPYCENPQSNYECWKNGTTFIQAFSQHFRKDPPISVDGQNIKIF